MMDSFQVTPTWVLAGNATLTIHNNKGVHFTYRIRKAESEGRPAAWFLSLLSGPDNENDYAYVGMLNANTGEVRTTKASKLRPDSLPIEVANWALKRIWSGKDFPAGYGCHHEGRCARCGRTLTTPASVESGFGPECIKKLAGV